ncbi:Hsp20/alpha crystallin family protein [Candidatus Pacearchaeota archaeon]|nr:Hsp20/alpha crystallin family protein [Candidatus Pacearchaeota archaeon]
MDVTNNNVFLEFDLEGFEEKDVDVKVEDNSISVKASSEVKDEAKIGEFTSYEKTTKDFSYFSNLPPVDSHNVKTDFDNGKLRVSIPRMNDGG